MNKKSIFISLTWIILFSLIFSYSLVFAWASFFSFETKVEFKLSDNLYIDSLSLNNTKVLFKSSEDLSDHKIKSKCNIFSKQTHNKWDLYMFELKLFNEKCDNNEFVLVDEDNNIKSKFNLNILSEYDILSKLLDLKESRLIKIKKVLDNRISSNSKFIEYGENSKEDYYNFLGKKRLLNEDLYNKKLIDNILEKRGEKYIVPVLNHTLPKRKDKIPNANRPYRENYTDWIHHSWDIDTKLWEQVVALDDAIVVRVVNDWKWSDFTWLLYWNLTEYQKMKNLDILRWNQIWLKTMKWDVIFYWHLEGIFNNIEEWQIVSKWQPIWTVGISWVPDKKYKDYHLDFSIRKNPYIKDKVWKYDFDDYMRWNWEFKWKTKDYILKNQWNIFEI